LKDRIREVRDHFDLSRKAFGFRMYVSQDVINNVERGRVEPTAMFIRCLCDEFGVSETWLRTGEGKMFDVEPDPDQAVLNEIAKEYKDNPVLRALLESYVKLSDAQRSAFDDYVMDFMDNYNRAMAERERAETLALIQRQVDVGEGLRTEDAI